MLSIWRENIDCQPVLSQHVVLNYISKYAAKAETKSESYRQMLARLSQSSHPAAPILNVIRKLLTETVADWGIGAQETCHMLQKLPLSLCSRSFVSLNVSCTIFRRVSHAQGASPPTPRFILAYMNRPTSLEALPLLEAARSWSFSARRKHSQWKHINTPNIVLVFPRYNAIPSSTDACYASFYWSELLLHFPFRTLPTDVGSTDEEIISHWELKKDTYIAWHVHDASKDPQSPFFNDTSTSLIPPHPDSVDMNECKFLSQLHPSNNLKVDDIDMLGSHDYDSNHN